MRIEHIHLRDFKSYHEAEIDLTGIQLASVVGPNGAGKSTILDAVVFALTGARSIRSLDGFIRQGCEECRVALTFATEGARWRITRTRSSRGGGKSTVELAREENGLWAAEGTGARETDARIQEVLGVDEDILMLTSIVAQGDAGSFFALRPAQRLEAFGQILKLDEQYGPLERYWKAAAETAKTQLEESRREIERLESDVAQLEQREIELGGARKTLESVRAQMVMAEEELERARESAREAQDAARSAGEAQGRLEELLRRQRATQALVDRLKTEHEHLTTSIAPKERLEAKLAQREGLQADIARLEDDQREEAILAEQRAAIRARLEAAKLAVVETSRQGKPKAAELDRADELMMSNLRHLEEIENAERPVCDRCGQSIQDESLTRTVQSLSLEHNRLASEATRLEKEVQHLRLRLAEQQAECERLQQELAAVPGTTFDPARLREARAALAKLDEIPAKLAEIAVQAERWVDVERGLAGAEAQLADPAFLKDLQAAQEAVAAAAGLATAATEAARAVKYAETEVETRRRELGDLEKTVARHEEAIALLGPSRERRAEAQVRAWGMETQQADADLLRKAFSKWGVPALIVGNVLMALEREVNDLLSLYDGGLAVRFESERETGSGSRDSLEIMVFDGEHWRPYETFSGGEKYRVASAMRLGLAMLLAHRSGARVESLVVDEPEGLDVEGRQHLARILERMSENVGLILLLTHYEDLKDAMPSQVIVSRDGDGTSHVEVTA